MRTCGGTERLCPTLYHAGLTSDLLALLRDFQLAGGGPVFLVGFSLGGNVALKLAGELGGRGPELIRGVCAASTPLDLEACARRLARPCNRLYERRFIGRMRARLCATGRYHERDFRGLRSIREIDDRITAPHFGMGTALNYYRTQSALRYLPGLDNDWFLDLYRKSRIIVCVGQGAWEDAMLTDIRALGDDARWVPGGSILTPSVVIDGMAIGGT